MDFVHTDLGHLGADEVVEVALGTAANVRLMDAANFGAYKRGGRHEYFGGHITRSPYRVSVPRSGHWYVAIDLGGHRGTVRAQVRVLS